MYPVYKRVKKLVPHCPDCGEELQGDNSLAYPYKCGCGVWTSNWSNPSNFTIKQENSNLISLKDMIDEK